MAVRVSPDEQHPTHHVALRDKKGKRLGLVLCNSNGDVSPRFGKNPVERTSLKTTSGNSTYSDFNYPYSPITQDDWSGGRGNLDFERDTTRFYDSCRVRTSRSNRVYLGAQEQYSVGHFGQDNNLPGNVVFHKLLGNRHVAKRFVASSGYTARMAWLIARRHGNPANLTIALHSDNSGQISSLLTSITVNRSRLPDILSEWLNEAISQGLTNGTAYWLVVNSASTDDADNYWSLGVRPTVGTTFFSSSGGAWPNWSSAGFDLYFRLTAQEENREAIFFEYKEQQYVVISGESGAPTVWMNGDRGTADPNTGNLNRLIDATKNWVSNAWTNCVVMITDGKGKQEAEPWRVIVGNTTTQLTVNRAWNEEHDTTTEYVILGANTWRQLSGHGLAAPVTDVLVSSLGVVYFAMGDGVNMRRHREYTNAGAWTENEWADDGTNKAVYLVNRPQAKKIFRGQNNDATGDVSVSSADPAAWGTNLTFSAANLIGSRHRRINQMECYPDENGNEAIWVFKTDIPWIVPNSGNPYPMSLREMETMRSSKNGQVSLVHNVYLYFSFLHGLERYYGGSLDDIGPNLGEGLPTDRQGALVALLGYPGKVFAGVDAEGGYSSLLERDGGWHERYRAPRGQRIKALGFQVVPGAGVDRLWIYQGNDLVWLPFPSNTSNEMDDTNYRYTHEGALVLSRMHAGMMDAQKLVKIIKIWTDNLQKDVCWIEMDYRLNEAVEWTTFEDAFNVSPQTEIDMTRIYGLAAKRIQLRLRFYTADASQTPVLLATIIEAVTRVSVKYMYPLTFRLLDREETLSPREPDDIEDGMEKLKVIEEWADDRSDGMLYMESVSRLWHGKMVFLNPPDTMVAQEGDERRRTVYVCSATLQEA